MWSDRSVACQGLVDEGRRLHARGRTTFREAGLLVTAAGWAMSESEIEWRADDPNAQEHVLRESVETLDRLRDQFFFSTVALVLPIVCCSVVLRTTRRSPRSVRSHASARWQATSSTSSISTGSKPAVSRMPDRDPKGSSSPAKRQRPRPPLTTSMSAATPGTRSPRRSSWRASSTRPATRPPHRSRSGCRRATSPGLRSRAPVSSARACSPHDRRRTLLTSP